MDNHWRQKALFVIGDYAAGGAVGAATALAVRVALRPEFDLALAMMAGMTIGMLIHLMAALFLSPFLGFFHTMVPGSLIGMYGGMLFVMRNSMEQQPSSLTHVILVGVIFGLVIVAGVRLYDRALHLTVKGRSFGKGIGAMNNAQQAKWDRASRLYDWMTWADDLRLANDKQRLFARMKGRCLMVAAGTGNDFRHFPPGLSITAIDVSPKMIERARQKASVYEGTLDLRVMDVQSLEFPDGTFDSAVSACTFCSITDPVRGLRELYRCLKPGGRLLMFEHVRSRFGPIALLQDLMTPISRRLGPDMNRDTVANLQRAGFALYREENVYLDVVKAIEVRRPKDCF